MLLVVLFILAFGFTFYILLSDKVSTTSSMPILATPLFASYILENTMYC